MNALLGPDVYSIMACIDRSNEFQDKLAALQKELDQVSAEDHPKLYLAMDSLKVCGDCRASAPRYCQVASRQLSEEVSVLLTASH